MRKHFLHRIFEPRSVAIVGASDRELSVGSQVLGNIIDGGFKGSIYPVNPNHDNLKGLQCYRSIGDIDHPVDLVIITIPYAAIPAVMRQCGERQVGAVPTEQVV